MTIKRSTAALGSVGWEGLLTLYLVSVPVRPELADSAGPPTDSPNLWISQACLGILRRAGGYPHPGPGELFRSFPSEHE